MTPAFGRSIVPRARTPRRRFALPVDETTLDNALRGYILAATSEMPQGGIRNTRRRKASAMERQDCCHRKVTPRSAALQDDLHKRLNRVIGQLNGVKGMIEDNRYCGDVLVQLAAAESAVHRVSEIMLQDVGLRSRWHCEPGKSRWAAAAKSMREMGWPLRACCSS